MVELFTIVKAIQNAIVKSLRSLAELSLLSRSICLLVSKAQQYIHGMIASFSIQGLANAEVR